MSDGLTRRGFLTGLSMAGLFAFLGNDKLVEKIAKLPDDLRGTTTTHRIDPNDFYCYGPGLTITIGENVGMCTAFRPGEIDIKWS